VAALDACLEPATKLLDRRAPPAGFHPPYPRV